MPPAYSELQNAPVLITAALLARRVEERFPGSGLARLVAELVRLAEENDEVVQELRRPLWWLRVLVGAAIVGLVTLAGWAAAMLVRVARNETGGLAELVQGVDAATSELIFLSLVLLFLASAETRLKRRTALRMLHRLRGVAHVVDMHQLNKDPDYAVRPMAATASSPVRELTRDQLTRYLDYCSEALSLISKLAALHAQHLNDPVVLGAVRDVESLTSDLSRKVWQKIGILLADARGGVAAGDPA